MSWLLLKNVQKDCGEVLTLQDVEATSNLPVSDVDQLTVAKAFFNGDSLGDAAKSLAHGGGVALRLLARQYRGVWSSAPLKKLSVKTLTPLPGSYEGRSADLLCALVTFLSLAKGNGLIQAPQRQFAATGTLDSDGVVGPVYGVVLKIEAALQTLPRGSIVFYPRIKPEDEARWVDQPLNARARDCGIELQPVEYIEEALKALGIDVLWWHRNQPPYRALGTYHVEHSPIFFGRDHQVTKFLERLRQAAQAKRPGGLVESASGAGKSSFVQAGLLARLRIEPRRAGKPVEYAVWQPRLAGMSQTIEIDESMVARSVLVNWKTHAGVNSVGFCGLDDLNEIHTLEDLGARLSRTGLDDRLLVWVVDQFEELFTQKYTDAARVAFARFLAQLQSLGVWVVCTLRAEFKSRLMALADSQGKPLLVDVFENLMFPLARMPVEALGQMITEPARVAGVSFETRADGVRLDALLCQDALGADSMPLVGYALNELWLKKQLPDQPDELGRKTPQLTFEAYKIICGGAARGGIRRVLGIEAERAYEQLPQVARNELPALLSELAVPVDGDEKEAAKPTDLAPWTESTPGWQLIEALREKRLLITESATETSLAQVRVVHEALFEGWDRAKEELENSRDVRTLIKRLKSRRNEWSKHGEPQDELLTSAVDLGLSERARPELLRRADLADVLRFVDLSLSERARKQRRVDEDRRRDKRRVLVFKSLVVLFALAVVTAVYSALKAQDGLNEATRQTALAETETYRASVAEADAKAKTRVAETAEKQAQASLTELETKTGELVLSQQGTAETLALARRNIDDVLTVLERPEMDDVHGFGETEQRLLIKLVPLERRLTERLGADHSQTGLVRSVRLEMRGIAQLRSAGNQVEAFKACQRLNTRLANMPDGERIPELIEARLQLMYRILKTAYLVDAFDRSNIVASARTLISRTHAQPGQRFWRESLAGPIAAELRTQGKVADALATLESARLNLSRALERQPHDRYALEALLVIHSDLAQLHAGAGRKEDATRHRSEESRLIKLGRDQFPRATNFARHALNENFEALDAALNAKAIETHRMLVSQAQSLIDRFRGASAAKDFEAGEARLFTHQANFARYVEQDSKKAIEFSRISLRAYSDLYGQRHAELANFASASQSVSALTEAFDLVEEQSPPQERSSLRSSHGRELVALSDPFVACARQMGPGADCSNLVVNATVAAVGRLKDRDPTDVAQLLQQREPLFRVAAEQMLALDRRYAEGISHQSRPSSEPLERWCRARRDLAVAQATTGGATQKSAARDGLEAASSDCLQWAARYDWDFYLRGATGDVLRRLADLHAELGHPEKALESLKRCWDARLIVCRDSYLKVLKSGQGVERNSALIAEVEKVSVEMRRFTLAARAKDAPPNGLSHPFHVYIMEESQLRRHKGIEDQAIWLLRNRGHVIHQDVREAFLKIEKIARDNKVSFLDLAVYALGASPADAIDDKEVAAIQSELMGASFHPGVEIASDGAGVALAGADVVEIFDNSKQVLGSHQFRYVHSRAIWLFKNAANRDRFAKDPAKFIPELGGHCIDKIASGSKEPGSAAYPIRFENRLYLARSEEAIADALKDLPGTVGRAREQWARLRDRQGTYTAQSALGRRLLEARRRPAPASVPDSISAAIRGS